MAFKVTLKSVQRSIFYALQQNITKRKRSLQRPCPLCHGDRTGKNTIQLPIISWESSSDVSDSKQTHIHTVECFKSFSCDAHYCRAKQLFPWAKRESPHCNLFSHPFSTQRIKKNRAPSMHSCRAPPRRMQPWGTCSFPGTSSNHNKVGIFIYI